MGVQYNRAGARRQDPVPSVTTAASGRSNDLASRQRRYLTMMGIRLACLPLAVISSGWVRWAFIIGAIVLPYVAVVIANAASRPKPGTLVPAVDPQTSLELLPSHPAKDPTYPD
jgi:hypothetical protein